MFDDLEALFYENALAAYNALCESLDSDSAGESTDLRLAVNAATALYHLREHFPEALQKSCDELTTRCPDYGLLGDIANASKHGQLDRGTPRLTSAQDIAEDIVITEYQDEHGPYRHAHKEVVVKLIDGSIRNVKDVLMNVLNMWVGEFHTIGLLKRFEPIEAKPFTIPARQSSNEGAPYGLRVIQGVRFAGRFRFEKYNYEMQRIEALDITNHSYSFSIYEPSYAIDIMLTNNATGERFTRTVKLSKDDNRELSHLDTEEGQLQFFERLLGRRHDVMEGMFDDAGVDVDLSSAKVSIDRTK